MTKWSLILAILLAVIAQVVPLPAAVPSFADFDRRAVAGEHLNVVFFGASLTWGANASDPLLTSYRGVVARRLEETYPQAHFKFWDAAIGGTNSQLGVFRFERDVLRRKPDLVFVDFTANDDIHWAVPETLASYESLVRRTILDAKAPIVQVIFPFQWDVAKGDTEGMQRRDAHIAIAKAYNTALGDAVTLGQERVRSGKATLAEMWPVDGVHPGDRGYEMFADAAWDAFRGAVAAGVVCAAPEKMLHAATYMKNVRARVAAFKTLPAGWHVGKPNVMSNMFDMVMSRWLDDEAIATNKPGPDGKKIAPAPLSVKFHGSMVLLFGESTPQSCKFRVYIDGKLVERKGQGGKQSLPEFDAADFAKRVNSRAYLVQTIVEGLDPNIEHTLKIEPIFSEGAEQELRLESICVAGGKAEVKQP